MKLQDWLDQNVHRKDCYEISPKGLHVCGECQTCNRWVCVNIIKSGLCNISAYRCNGDFGCIKWEKKK